jgi:hypothetical protein
MRVASRFTVGQRDVGFHYSVCNGISFPVRRVSGAYAPYRIPAEPPTCLAESTRRDAHASRGIGIPDRERPRQNQAGAWWRQVFIVPDGALESLPLGVLVTQAPETDPRSLADYRDIDWFARDRALTVLPSVGALRALRKFASGNPGAAPFAGIGNPMLEGTPGVARSIKLASLFRGAVADIAAVRQLPPLPETADELRAVAKAMGLAMGTFISPRGPQNRYCARPGSTATASSSSRRMG